MCIKAWQNALAHGQPHVPCMRYSLSAAQSGAQVERTMMSNAMIQSYDVQGDCLAPAKTETHQPANAISAGDRPADGS
jgi:hypothetical protein